jgi:Flp pilus assembly protein TadD
MSLRPRLVATCTLAVTAVCSGAAREVSYRDLVEAYRRDPPSAVLQVVARPNADLDRQIRAIEAATPGDRWSTEDLNAAALMHTEATLALIADKRDAAVLDHAEFARRLIVLAALDPEDAPFAYQWHSAFAQLLRDRHAPGTADLVQRQTSRLSHIRSAIAFQAALVTEVLGCERAAARPNSGYQFDTPVYWSGGLAQAAAGFESVLKDNPDLLLAAVHLGRLRMLGGRDGDAKALFQRAAAAHDRLTAYLAHLFLGVLAEREERFAEAEGHYRSSVAIVANAQSARLALASMLARIGKPASLADLLEPAVVPARDRYRFDPWWTYLALPQRDAWNTILRLRAGLLR